MIHLLDKVKGVKCGSETAALGTDEVHLVTCPRCLGVPGWLTIIAFSAATGALAALVTYLVNRG